MHSERSAHRPIRALLVLACLWLAGCAVPGGHPPDTGDAVVLDQPGLAIRGRYHPPAGPGSTRLWVVIEGDGATWTGGRPPVDPTPLRPVGPSVVSVLPAGDARLWLARPCQYLRPEALRGCDPAHWTGSRFSDEVLTAYDRLIDRYAAGSPVMLVGFSGGGVIAADLALRRDDAAGLVTLAAPLDLDAWTGHHAVPSLAATQSSARRLARLARLDIPALYLFGAADRTVPTATLGRTRAVLPQARLRVVPRAGHAADWAAILAPHLVVLTRR